jgi:AraC family transcriptional regulator
LETATAVSNFSFAAGFRAFFSRRCVTPFNSLVATRQCRIFHFPMNADIHTLFESNFYRILDFRCRCTDCITSKPEYSNAFCISVVRTGNFLFNVFRNALDSYTGRVLVTKPGYERTVTHVHEVPDECTIFEFKPSFYEAILEQYGGLKFLFDNDTHATLLKVHPEIELLHARIMREIAHRTPDKLLVDCLVMDVIKTVMGNITDYQPEFDVYDNVKLNHLVTIEMAKTYITTHFQDNISLADISNHCHVSPFHFSRLFKKLTSWPPHQFLSQVRLKYAALLLQNTEQSVSDVAFTSGFNSVEHFTAAFRERHGFAPGNYRKKLSKKP